MADEGFLFKINPLFLCLLFVFILLGRGMEAITAFGLVVLHEIVHFLCAFKEGFKLKNIEIFPFGGIVEFEGMLEMHPFSEIKVALFGPLFNLISALILYILIYFDVLYHSEYIYILLNYNLLLGLFNLLPALPLDGGRIMRGVLTLKMGFKKGTEMAIKITRFLAVVGMLIGVFSITIFSSNFFILLISFFVYGAILREENRVIYRLISFLARREKVFEDLCIKPVSEHVVKKEVYLRHIITSLLPEKYNIFLVLDDEFVLQGRVTETRVLDSYFSTEKQDLRVGDLVED